MNDREQDPAEEPEFQDLVKRLRAAHLDSRFRALNRRRAGKVPAGLAQMFRARPCWPVVKYDPSFAVWQSQFGLRTAAWWFQRIKESL